MQWSIVAMATSAHASLHCLGHLDGLSPQLPGHDAHGAQLGVALLGILPLDPSLAPRTPNEDANGQRKGPLMSDHRIVAHQDEEASQDHPSREG